MDNCIPTRWSQTGTSTLYASRQKSVYNWYDDEAIKINPVTFEMARQWWKYWGQDSWHVARRIQDEFKRRGYWGMTCTSPECKTYERQTPEEFIFQDHAAVWANSGSVGSERSQSHQSREGGRKRLLPTCWWELCSEVPWWWSLLQDGIRQGESLYVSAAGDALQSRLWRHSWWCHRDLSRSW